jgi:hypothetical protein
MKAVIYDPAGGAILQRNEGARASIERTAALMGMAWLQVRDDQPYERTHIVQGGVLLPIDPPL